MNMKAILAAAGVSAMCLGGASEAGVIFDNETRGSTGGGYAVGEYPGSTNVYDIGFSFVVPVGSNPELAGGSYVASFGGGPVNDAVLSLYASSGGLAGTVLETWDINNVLGANSAIIPFVSALHPVLAGGQTYWLVAAMSDATSFSYWWTPATSGTGGLEAVSLNSGAFYLFALPSSYSLGAFQILSVPEPSTWVMALVGFAGLGVLGFRRTRTVAAG